MTAERARASIRFLLWVYFALLIGEGALRKWAFPEQSDLIFLARDPLVVVIYALAWRAEITLGGRHTLVFWLLATLSLIGAIIADIPWLVAAFGVRTNFLHLPLIFVIGAIFDRADVRRVGLVCLWLALPITALMLVQFNSPRDSWINVGVGAQSDGQILGALDRVRPPGPFSFISGLVMFFNLVAAFLLAGWLHRRSVPPGPLLLATLATVAAVPVSISRSLLFVLLVLGLFGLAAALRDFRRLPHYLAPLTLAALGLLIAADTVYVEAFQARWVNAMEAGGGSFETNVIERLLGEFTLSFQHAVTAPWTGHGIGMGTLAGARLATGQNTFLLAESEWSRIVLELGPFVGFAFIAWRVGFAVSLLIRGWRAYVADGDPLAWLLAGASFFLLLNAQWGPSTHLGFAVFTAGLCCAALTPPPDDPDEAPAPSPAPEA